MGNWFFTYNNFAEAEAAIMTAHARKETCKTHKILGWIDLKHGRYDKACSHLFESLSLETDPEVYKLLGRLCYETTDYDSSAFYYQRFLDWGDSLEAGAPLPLIKANTIFFRRSERDVVLARLAINCSILADSSKARSLISEISPENSEVPDIIIANVHLLISQGKQSEAESILENLMGRTEKLYITVKVDPVLGPLVAKILDKYPDGFKKRMRNKR